MIEELKNDTGDYWNCCRLMGEYQEYSHLEKGKGNDKRGTGNGEWRNVEC